MSPEALRELGRHVAEREDAALEGARPDDALREHLVARVALRRSTPPRLARRWLPLGAAIAMATLAAFALLFRGAAREPPIGFDVGADRRTGHLHAWMSAPADAPLPLRFSDGSTVELEPGARARVVETTALGAEVVVERGAARVHVVHVDGASWRVHSGPFVVHVTGTRFSVDWNATRDTVTVQLDEGSVRVSGCRLGEPGQPLSAGQRLEASCATGRASIGPLAGSMDPANAVPSTPSPQGAEPSLPAQEPTEPVAAKRRRQTVSETPAGIATWQRLAREGRYAESIASAAARGLDDEIARADAAELLLLGDAARLGGRGADAPRIYARVRARFPTSSEAARAAFNLGRIDSMAGRYASAAQWYETYLHEQPAGAFAEPALGRLIEARARAGDMTAARAAATRYLAAFPGGAHADDATRVLESSP